MSLAVNSHERDWMSVLNLEPRNLFPPVNWRCHGHDVATCPRKNRCLIMCLIKPYQCTMGYTREKTRWMGHQPTPWSRKNPPWPLRYRLKVTRAPNPTDINWRDVRDAQKRKWRTHGRPSRRLYTVHLKASSGMFRGWKPFSFHVFAGLWNIISGRTFLVHQQVLTVRKVYMKYYIDEQLSKDIYCDKFLCAKFDFIEFWMCWFLQVRKKKQ